MPTVNSEFEHNGRSALVQNIQTEARDMDLFPVLIGNDVAYFHSVSGGYSSDRGATVVNLIHTVQGDGSPHSVRPAQASHSVEAHLSDNYYYFDVSALRTVDDYPDDDYVLSMVVDSYQFGQHSFSDQLEKDIDRRERSERL